MYYYNNCCNQDNEPTADYSRKSTCCYKKVEEKENGDK